MSISSAFNGALSGLQAFAKKSELISSNIANATTPGYGARGVDLTSNEVAAGVVVGSVSRAVDPAIVAARRSAEAAFYCSTACSKRDWQRHKQVCQKWKDNVPAA